MTAFSVAVVLDDPIAIGAGPLRALEEICAHSNLALAAIIAGPGTGGSGVFAAVMGLEAALFARPRQIDAPCFGQTREATPIIDYAAAGVLGCDAIIDFTSAGAPDAIAAGARTGLWRLTAFDQAAGFDAAANNEAATPVALIRKTEGGASIRLVARAFYGVKFSAARNAAFIREKSVQLLMRELVRAAIDGQALDNGAYTPLPGGPPGVAKLARYGAGLAGALAERGIAKAREKAGQRPGMFFLKYGRGGPLDFDPASAREITPVGNCYWADPFCLEQDGKTYVFFEKLDYQTRCGSIDVGVISDGAFHYLGAALETGYHLSYPFLFRERGELYMLPETSATRRLEVWRCVRFPDQWELAATALEGRAATDSVLFNKDGAWWLFTNMTSDSYGDHCAELHLFSADGPMLHRLEPHRLNPVVISSRTARGGGRIIADGGRLLRMSQDNAFGVYGYGLNVMEITRLDRQGYEEQLVRRIAPDFEPGLIGCHHVDFANGFFVMDVRRRLGGRSRNAV